MNQNDDDILLNLGNSVTLAQGESITLTLKDSHVLDSDPSDRPVLEDVRLTELEKYAKYARQKAKISQATGILPVNIDDEDDESKPSNLYDPHGFFDDQNDVFKKPAKLKAGSILQLDSPTKFIQRQKLTNKKHRHTVFSTTVNWDNLFNEDLQTPVNDQSFQGLRKKAKTAHVQQFVTEPIFYETAAKSLQVKSAPEPPVKSRPEQMIKYSPQPPKWSVLAADEDETEQEMLHLVLDNPPPKVKDEYIKEEQIMEDLFPLEELKGPSLSATAEFAKSLLTPLEKLEENRPTTRRRAAIQVSSTKPPVQVNIPSTAEETFTTTTDTVLDAGLAGALEFIKKRGDLNAEDKWSVGRIAKVAKVPLHKGVADDDVKIDYTDNFGRVMNAKEAFRYMSWNFHGKQPGKAKMEKRLKKMELEHKLKTNDPSESMPTLKALRATQTTTGSAYMVLSTTSENNTPT